MRLGASLWGPLFAAAFALSPSAVFGQTEIAGQLRGRVTDNQDGLIPGVTIRVKDVVRGLEDVRETDAAGEYRFTRLEPGEYRVEAFRPGLQRQVAENVRITVGNTEVRDFRLAVGDQNFVVTVIGVPPVVDTERARQADTFRREMVTDTPIDRRDYLTFSLLAPGVADSKGLADTSDFRVVQTPNSGLSL